MNSFVTHQNVLLPMWRKEHLSCLTFFPDQLTSVNNKTSQSWVSKYNLFLVKEQTMLAHLEASEVFHKLRHGLREKGPSISWWQFLLSLVLIKERGQRMRGVIYRRSVCRKSHWKLNTKYDFVFSHIIFLESLHGIWRYEGSPTLSVILNVPSAFQKRVFAVRSYLFDVFVDCRTFLQDSGVPFCVKQLS